MAEMRMARAAIAAMDQHQDRVPPLRLRHPPPRAA